MAIKTIRMKKRDADLWLAALRSGRYKQARATLFDSTTGGYCCLGVMEKCLLDRVDQHTAYGHSEAAVLPKASTLDELGISFKDAGQPRFDDRPWPVAAPEFGNAAHVMLDEDFMSKEYGRMFKAGEWISVAALNDGGYDFNKIADLLERHIETY